MKVYLAYEDADYEGLYCDVVRKVFSTEEKALLYMEEENKSRGYKFVSHIVELEVE